jgi:hypothetical protein
MKINLMKEKEIHKYDRKKGQLLIAENYVENIFIAIRFASKCWKKKNKNNIFDYEEAIRIANELCAYFRLAINGKIKE